MKSPGFLGERTVRTMMLLLILAGGGTTVAYTAPAPIPAPIAAARTILLTNGGVDQQFLQAFEKAGDVNLAYDDLYASMQSWGHYSVVTSPEQADLVVEMNASAPLNILQVYAPCFTVRIYDGKSHFLLWSLTLPVDGAFRKATFEKNVQKAVDNGISAMKALVAVRPAP